MRPGQILVFLVVLLGQTSCASEPLEAGAGSGQGGRRGSSGEQGEAGDDMNGLSGSGGAVSSGDHTEQARSSCEAASAAFCESVYPCFSAEELRELDLPVLEEECPEQLVRELGCDKELVDEFCAEGERYDVAAARRCLEQSRSATCESVRAGAEFAPACNEMCVD